MASKYIFHNCNAGIWKLLLPEGSRVRGNPYLHNLNTKFQKIGKNFFAQVRGSPELYPLTLD